MSSIPQITDDGNSVTDFATKFLKRFHIGYLLVEQRIIIGTNGELF